MSDRHSGKWDGRADAATNARRELPLLTAEYFARVREALAKNPPAEKLHRLRLATKRLRYTLELFRPCYGPALEKRLGDLRRIQQLLGDVNDAVVTAQLLPKGARPRVKLERRAAAKAEEFRKHWAEDFDAEGREALWTGYLARNARKEPNGRR